MEMLNDLSKIKSCFGRHENCDNSWHCKGCIVEKECANEQGDGNYET